MTKPPIRKKQDDYIQVKVRLPRLLHEELHTAADSSARSLNAEIVSRLQESPYEDLKRQNDEIKAMIRQLLDRT